MSGFAGIDGFLGTRASLMLDVVFLAMFLIVPTLAVSIYLVKVRRRYRAHKNLQLTIATVLLAAVTLFEIDMRINGWRDRAEPSPYFDSSAPAGLGDYALWIHLFFAVSTAVLWIAVTWRALRRFPDPPQPSDHSAEHKFWAWLAALDLAATSFTGWIFYWLAFVAT
jgi:putative membrane protein